MSTPWRSALAAFVAVLLLHAGLQWFAWAAHPGHTVGGIVLPWWPTVWRFVTIPVGWLTTVDLAKHWELIVLNGVVWASLAGIGAFAATMRRPAR